jgi:hypothetical protein
MVKIGLFSDSDGDLLAFDAALKFLAEKGARRFMFAGGNYADLDAWVQWKRDAAKSANDYTDADFLEDISRYLGEEDQKDRPPAFGHAYEVMRTAEESARVKNKIVRTPEKGSLAYQDPSVPRKAVDMIGDTLCCLVHDKNDLDKEDMVNSVVLVHGKEAEPKLVQIGPRFFVTPGRLKGGPRQTLALLELTEMGLKFSAWELGGAPIIENQSITIPRTKKISVK